MTDIKDKNIITGMEIAVIGMAGRFPGTRNIDEFWDNLKKGKESISFFSDEELEEAGIAPERFNSPGYVKAKGVLEDIERFDAAFFDYTAKEAEIMDPQLRFLHETCWKALENAGYDPWSYKGLIGLYAGASNNHLWLSRFLARVIENSIGENELFEIGSLNSNSSFCTRVSYKLNLKGPSIFVQTACSTSLVAIHLACQSLLAGECDMALAGGVSISIPKKSGYFYQEGMLHSLKGHVRTFDAQADGTVFGNGMGIVVLKPLEEAIVGGDTLHAVVKGSAVNNDGYQKVGFTAPGTKGQAAVIRRALQAAEVEPESISYIEAHGTGTTLGDPIEIEALTMAFKTNKTGFCKIGSVKSNIGHLDAAAGVSGFIKTVLALKHRVIPPSVNFETPNPEIDFENTPFRVNDALTEWKNEKYPLRAGVSSFGIGGTNAHVILEEAPPCVIGQPSLVNGQSRQHQLILLSARTESALDKMMENLMNDLENNYLGNPIDPGNPGLNLANAAYTLQMGRKAFEWRRMWVCPNTGSDVAEAVEALTSGESKPLTTFVPKKNENRPVVFMFPGQGAQYVNMGLDLYKTEPVFREQMDRCFEILKPLMAYDIKAILYPSLYVSSVSSVAKNNPAPRNSQPATSTERINETEIAQPLLFIFEYALSKLLMKWGIKPYAMMGHSIGEYTAACLAGVFSLQDALTAVALRGKLMQQMPGGSMLSISLPEEELITFLTEKISLAAVNSPESCTVSGTHEAIASLAKKLEEKGSNCRRLHTSHAFHSQMMEPILIKFSEKVKEIKLNQPEIPYISNLTGNWITGGEAGNPGYWAKHLRETVRFSEGVQELLKKEEDFIFVEVGPGKTLSTFVNQHKKNRKNQWMVNLIKHPKEDVFDDYYLLDKIGQLWLHGVFIDWEKFYTGEKRRRIPLPTYPFEGQRYWFEENLIPMGKIVKESGEPGTIDSIERERPERLHKRPGLSTVYTPPTNEIEKKLVNIWEKFFGVGQIGIDDDFFELGGDSLKISIVISKIHKEFNAEVPIAEFFSRSTIRNLALFIADNVGKSTYSSIEPVEKREYYQLSSAQKRLYILNEIGDQGIGYNQQSFLLLEGDLDYAKIKNTLRRLTKRHESLRTSFEMTAGEPVQSIHSEIDFEIEYFDLATEDTEKREKIHPSKFIIQNSFIRPFDLSRPPMLRVGVIKEEEEKYILMVDLHHIIADGTSMGLLIREAMSIYGGEALPEFRIQYKDYSAWQNSREVRETIQQQEEYWLKEFEGEVPILDLPMDYPRPLIQSFEGSAVSFKLGSRETQALKEFARQEGVTLYIMLLAITNILFSKLSGQEDIVIGSPIVGRGHGDLGNIIGMFVNTLAMRNYPQGEKTFREFLGNVKKRGLEAFDNQEYQFEDLVEKVSVSRDITRNPLFDVMLILQNMFDASEEIVEVEIEGLKIKPYDYESRRSLFDLTLFASEAGERLHFAFEYCTKLFKEETILRFIEYFKTIISSVLENPGKKISAVEILSEEERNRMLYDFNDTQTGYPRDKPLHEIFEEQVGRTPDNIALVFEDKALSYRGLNEKANQVANYLYSKIHILPEELVGVLMDRSLNIVTSILGILKAGGAYVPIDSSLPEVRIKYIIDDARIGIVLSERFHIKVLNRLQWECKNFHTFLCMDSTSVYEEDEVEKNELMDERMWRYIGESAENEIEGGGWASSYTGEPLSKEEMQEYSDNVFNKLRPFLRKDMRVLEVGCASGITMYRIAPYVSFYLGTDLSRVIIEKNRSRIEAEGHKNIVLDCLPAHEIDRIEEENFDLIIINSVIQYFHGHNYLRKVIAKAVDKLAKKGFLFLGDIMDQELKNELIRETKEFKRTNTDKNCRTKTDWSAELFVSHGFLEDLAVQKPEIQEIEFSDKMYTLENELTKFRFDAFITIDKSHNNVSKTEIPQKHQHDLNMLDVFGTNDVVLPGDRKVSPHVLAYAMYTSGTTGLPKGIMIGHRPIINFIKGITDVVDFREGDRILSLTTISFDIFGLEALLPITRGSRVVIGNRDEQLDPAVLANTICKQDISIFQLTPSRLHMLLSGDISKQQLKSLRYLLVGGEAFSEILLKEARELIDGEIFNLYGPTETTIWSAIKDVSGEKELNIGHPIANTKVLILDKNKKLLPVKVAGELCIGGDGLARGYLNRPELTAEKFDQDLSDYQDYQDEKKEGTGKIIYKQKFFGGSRGAILQKSPPGRRRLYKTGDLARWLPDGNLEFLGRIDHQVKIRGFRIELEEIEHRLSEIDYVTKAVVIDKKEESGEKYLCAYIISQKEIVIPEIKDSLAGTLPDYMIPSRFVQLEEFPLTPNGKIDRKALISYDIKESASVEFTPPESEMEKRIADIWKEVLQIDQVGIRDNFFDIGGHSLSIIKVNTKLKGLFDKDISVAAMFRYPTIISLVEYFSSGETMRLSSDARERIDESVSLMDEATEVLFADEID